MCNAFSCIVLKSRKVIWKLGTDSHDDLLRSASIADDTKDPAKIMFCRIEISPENKDYVTRKEFLKAQIVIYILIIMECISTIWQNHWYPW